MRIAVVLITGAIVWQSIQIGNMRRRVAELETRASILLAGYKTEREHREMTEAAARGEQIK